MSTSGVQDFIKKSQKEEQELENTIHRLYLDYKKKGGTKTQQKFSELAIQAFKGTIPIKPNSEVNEDDELFSRLINNHMEHSYVANSESTNHTVLDRIHNRDHGLKDKFGEYLPDYSNSDYAVYKKGNDLTVAFRGSKSPKKMIHDSNSVDDWKHNAETHFKSKSEFEKTGTIRRINGNLDELRKAFPGSEYKYTGYSKGGFLALFFGHKHGVSTRTYNPNIAKNNTHVLTGGKAGDVTHEIVRTNEDAISMGIGFLKKMGPNVNLRVVSTMRGTTNALSAHAIKHFHDRFAPREVGMGNLSHRLDAHVTYAKIKKTMVASDWMHKNPGATLRQFIEKYGPHFTKVWFNYRIATGRPAKVSEIELEEIVNETQQKRKLDVLEERAPDAPKKRLSARQMEKSAIGRDYGVDPSRGTELRTFRDSSRITPADLASERIPPPSEIRRRSAREMRKAGVGRDYGVDPTSRSFEMETFRDHTAVSQRNGVAYMKANPKMRGNLLEAHNRAGKQAVLHMGADYIDAYTDQTRMFLEGHIRASREELASREGRRLDRVRRFGGSATKLLNVRGLAAGGLIGASAGFDAALNAIPGFDKLSGPVQDTIAGGMVGALTDTACSKLAGESLTGAARAGRMLSSGLEGTVGMGVGIAATNAIENAMADDPAMEREIVSNIFGGEIGTMSGIGAVSLTGAAIGAGSAILSGAGVEGAIAAANEWNPFGWAMTVAAAATAVVGGIVGIFTGFSEQRKENYDKAMSEDRSYEAQNLTAQGQIDYLKTYFDELGGDPHKFDAINKAFIQRMGSSGLAQAFNADEFKQLFQTMIDTYTFTGQVDNQMTTQEHEKEYGSHVQQQAEARRSSLLSLQNTINTRLPNGAHVNLPQPLPSTSDGYVALYNSLIDAVPAKYKPGGSEPVLAGINKLSPPRTDNTSGIGVGNLMPPGTFSGMDHQEQDILKLLQTKEGKQIDFTEWATQHSQEDIDQLEAKYATHFVDPASNNHLDPQTVASYQHDQANVDIVLGEHGNLTKLQAVYWAMNNQPSLLGTTTEQQQTVANGFRAALMGGYAAGTYTGPIPINAASQKILKNIITAYNNKPTAPANNGVSFNQGGDTSPSQLQSTPTVTTPPTTGPTDPNSNPSSNTNQTGTSPQNVPTQVSQQSNYQQSTQQAAIQDQITLVQGQIAQSAAYMLAFEGSGNVTGAATQKIYLDGLSAQLAALQAQQST